MGRLRGTANILYGVAFVVSLTIPVFFLTTSLSRAIEYDEDNSQYSDENLKDLADQTAIARYSIYFWGGAFVLIVIGVGSLLVMVNKRAKKEQEFLDRHEAKKAQKKKTKSGAFKETTKIRANFSAGDELPEFSSPPSIPSMAPADMKVTEKTREAMVGLINSVRSISAVQDDPSKTVQPIDTESLKNSAVLEALAETMVSEVSTEESNLGKFSKMTVEGALLFDENDLPPDLEEYRAEHGDEGLERYTFRISFRNNNTESQSSETGTEGNEKQEKNKAK